MHSGTVRPNSKRILGCTWPSSGARWELFLGGVCGQNLSQKIRKFKRPKGHVLPGMNVTRGTLPTCKGGRGRPQLQ